MNVRADWEGIGIVVLSLLVGGFLLLGIVRTILRLRSRRSKRKSQDAAPAASGSASAPAPPAVLAANEHTPAGASEPREDTR